MKKFLFLNFVIVVKTAMSKLRDTELVKYVNTILESLTGNTNFPDQQADAAAIASKNKAFNIAIGKVKHGPAGAAAEKDQLRAELEQEVKFLGDACAKVAKGNTAIFLSSGFSFREPSHPVKVLDTPTKVSLKQGTRESELELAFKDVPQKRYYEVTVGSDTESVLFSYTITAAKFTLTNCKPGMRYYVRVRACGSGDVRSGWSEFVSRIAA